MQRPNVAMAWQTVPHEPRAFGPTGETGTWPGAPPKPLASADTGRRLDRGRLGLALGDATGAGKSPLAKMAWYYHAHLAV
jgi:hypothetical protein